MVIFEKMFLFCECVQNYACQLCKVFVNSKLQLPGSGAGSGYLFNTQNPLMECLYWTASNTEEAYYVQENVLQQSSMLGTVPVKK